MMTQQTGVFFIFFLLVVVTFAENNFSFSRSSSTSKQEQVKEDSGTESTTKESQAKSGYKAETLKFNQYTRAQRESFQAWMQTHNKTYSASKNSSLDKAAQNYVENEKRISNFNSKTNTTFKQGHNKYSDCSYEENKKKRTGLKLPKSPNLRNQNYGIQVKTFLPKTVNYREFMPPIKDQKDCGACYAFAGLSAVEYDYRKRTNRSTLASEQDVIDCDVLSFGCDGGWPTRALQYARDFGVADGNEYKYANSRQLCLRHQFPPVLNVSRTCELKLDGNEDFMKYLVSKRPVVAGFSITVNFMYYKSGIFNDPACTKDIDHAVLIIGYGTDPITKLDYWIIRNSWSTAWGMKGYGYVARNAGNMCGITSWAMYVC